MPTADIEDLLMPNTYVRLLTQEFDDLATIAAGMGVEEESIRTIKYRCMMKLRAFRRTISGEDQQAI